MNYFDDKISLQAGLTALGRSLGKIDDETCPTASDHEESFDA